MNSKTKRLTLIALLSTLAIIIPLLPFKIIIPPAMTMTLASHTPIWLATFISPLATLCVVIASTLGYFFSPLPFVVPARALSHVIFAILASIYIKKAGIPKTIIGHTLFAVSFSVIHAIAEVLVVWFFFFPSSNSNPLFYVWIVVGLGTFIHSIIDYIFAVLIWGTRRRIKNGNTSERQPEQKR